MDISNVYYIYLLCVSLKLFEKKTQVNRSRFGVKPNKTNGESDLFFANLWNIIITYVSSNPKIYALFVFG